MGADLDWPASIAILALACYGWTRMESAVLTHRPGLTCIVSAIGGALTFGGTSVLIEGASLIPARTALTLILCGAALMVAAKYVNSGIRAIKGLPERRSV